MNVEYRLGGDLITEIFVRYVDSKMPRDLNVKDFQLALVSWEGYRAVVRAFYEKFRAARIWCVKQDFQYEVGYDREYKAYSTGFKIPEFVFWIINELHFRDLSLGYTATKEYEILLHKLKGYGLTKIKFEGWKEDQVFNNQCHEVLRLIYDAKKLKELIDIPANFLCRLPPDLELSYLSTTINTHIKKLAKHHDPETFLRVSTRMLKIKSKRTCLLFTTWLKNVKATTVHLVVKNRTIFDFSAIELAKNCNINKIHLDLSFNSLHNDFNMATLMENLHKCYPQTVDLEIVIMFIYRSSEPGVFLTSAKKQFDEAEAKTDECRTLPLDICKLELRFVANETEDFAELYLALMDNPWHGFEQTVNVLDDSEQNFILEKAINFGANKSMKFSFYASAPIIETNFDHYEDLYDVGD